MAAPTVVGASADAQWTNTGSLTALLPAGLQDGDLLILLVFVRNGGQTIDLTSGYTLISEDDSSTEAQTTTEVQAKTASSESAPSVTSSQTSTQATGACLIAIRGWSGTIGDLIISAESGGASATITAPSVTTTADDSLVLRCYLNADDNTVVTGPLLHTQKFSESTAIGSDAAMHVYSIEQATAGATGTADLVVSGSDAYQVWTVAIPPSAGGSSLAIGGAVETDSAGALTRVKSAALGGSTETDTAGALSRGKSLAIGGAVESDAAGSLTRGKSLAIGSAVETDTAGSLGRGKSLALAGASETDVSGGLTRAKSLGVAGAVESDTAGSLTRAKSLALGGAVETDTAGSTAIGVPAGPAPAERTYIVPAESRTIAVAAEPRTLTVAVESRVLTVAR